MNRILVIGLTPFSSGINTFIKNTYPYMDQNLFQYDFLLMEQYRGVRKLPAVIDPAKSNYYYLDFTRNEFPESSYAKFEETLTSIPDIRGIHVHDINRITYPLVVADRMGLPIKVIHFHTGCPKHQKDLSPLTTEEKNRLELIKDDRFDRLACSDLAGREGFRGLSYEVIPNGIDPQKFTYNPLYRRLIREKMQLPEETYVLGFFANIHMIKNPIFALRVFQEFLKLVPSAILLFVGLNHTDKQLQKYIHENQLMEHIRFLQTDDSIDMLYSAVDLLLFPSIREGIGYVLIEAQASGLPCLISDEVTDQAKITDLAHMMSLDVSPKEWAKKALQILQGCKKRVSRTKEILDAGFHAEDVTKKLQSIYARRLKNNEV